MENDNRRKLLVVEDESDLRELIVETLQDLGVQVRGVENGAVAFELLQQEHFDVVMTDIKMPKMTGIELIQNLKKVGNDVSIVILSAFGDKENILDALRLGAVDYIEKPFNDEVLKSVLSRTLEISARRQQVENWLDQSVSKADPGKKHENLESIRNSKKMDSKMRLLNQIKRKAS